MKDQLLSVFCISLLILLTSTTFPAKKQNLYGKWKMVSGTTNGLPNSPISLDRTWEFKKDNWFEGVLFVENVPRPYNQGIFMLPNDTTMVTIHADKNGNLSKVAYTYNYSFKGDTLHLDGFYMANVRDTPGLLQLMHIDEKWVRIK